MDSFLSLALFDRAVDNFPPVLKNIFYITELSGKKVEACHFTSILGAEYRELKMGDAKEYVKEADDLSALHPLFGYQWKQDEWSRSKKVKSSKGSTISEKLGIAIVKFRAGYMKRETELAFEPISRDPTALTSLA
jgi:hypothetical protein